MVRINFSLPKKKRCESIQTIFQQLNITGRIYTKYILTCDHQTGKCTVNTLCESILFETNKKSLKEFWQQIHKKYNCQTPTLFPDSFSNNKQSPSS